jgi:hypothetical protein
MALAAAAINTFLRYELGAVIKDASFPIANDDDGVVHSVRSLEAGDLAVEPTL